MNFRITSEKDYNEKYEQAKNNPANYWGNVAQEFDWFKKWDEVFKQDLKKGKVEWFLGGKTNISYNCLDRHLEKRKDQIAIIWEPNDPNAKTKKITYGELHEKTCQFANMLQAKGIKKGDRVCIYMPMCIEAAVAMLGAMRIGAVHSIVFAGFSAKSLADRINDSGTKILITSDKLYRGDKVLNLFDIANEALQTCDSIKEVILYRRGEEKIESDKKISIWQDEIDDFPKENKAEELDSEDPSFILYTSGSTGKPKGVLHSTGGYMVYAAYSFQNVFQYNEGNIYFCTADIGWITGHTYMIYGPLLSGATSVMFEGVPTYPNASRFWQIIEKLKVNIFYTAPTAIRALMQKGDDLVEGFDLTSLKVLGTVGEPINEEAWEWYNEKIGKGKCPIVDTWWQTETGGILISPLAGITKTKPCYATKPLPGIIPVILNDNAEEITQDGVQGNLCFKQAWPSMIRSTWGDHQRCIDVYFSNFPGYYFSGDGCFRDKDGNYRIIGRVDDVINVSGHRFGTAEIEDAINKHEAVSESAVIGFPHQIKGEGIYAFVIVKKDMQANEKEISDIVVQEIGAIARPDKIIISNDLPKTRSGKIMRRVLKKIAAHDNDLGDISTLVNPEIVEVLKKLA